MSIKRYCDVCGLEMDGYGVFVFIKTRLGVKIQIKVMDSPNDDRPDICEKCVMEIINNGTTL